MVPEFVRLEIAVPLGGLSEYYLLHICADGSGTDTWHRTLEDALHQAKFEFNIEPSEWRDCE
jgi:hypothetical protein